MKFMKYLFCLAILLSACTSFAQKMYTVTDLQIGNQLWDEFPRWGYAFKMNNLGQVVGVADGQPNCFAGAFRTAPNSPVNPATDFLACNNAGSSAYGINDSGQVTGGLTISESGFTHAFRTAPNSPINPATDDLGTLGGRVSYGYVINASGQVAGMSETAENAAMHAFRTAPNSAIHPETDDLGTLGGRSSVAYAIDAYGQVLGTAETSLISWTHVFLYSNGVMHDVTRLVELRNFDPCKIPENGIDINAAGQILVQDVCGYYLLLNPIYKASVQPPIHSDGSSVFSIRRGVVPVKFALTQYGSPTCTLLPATIAVVRTSGEPQGPIAESTYSGNANDGPNFRIDADACQYIYNLPTAELGVGSYRLDISINGIMVGHAGFALH